MSQWYYGINQWYYSMNQWYSIKYIIAINTINSSYYWGSKSIKNKSMFNTHTGGLGSGT